MSTLLIALLVLLALLLAGAAALSRRGPGGGASAAPPPTQPAPQPPAPAMAPGAPAALTVTPAARPAALQAATPGVPPAALPEALRHFRLVPHESLPPDQVAALLQRLQHIAPPPLTLHKLVSAEFLEAARPSALADLIMAESQIAARLLATVNSPKYGLRKPVASVVQAVSLLGLNTVRALCLQHLLHGRFPSGGPAQAQRLDRLMRASTLTSTLCNRLVVQLELPEPGALVTQGVLSFLGQLATTSLLTPGTPAWGPHDGLLQRLDAEQAALGLGAGEIGGLLMQAWGLPASIVADVRDIDSLLVTPSHLIDPRRGPRLALCHLCARLGERLAQHPLTDLAELADLMELAHLGPTDTASADSFHLRSHLASPVLARLGEALRAPELLQAMRQAQQAAAPSG